MLVQIQTSFRDETEFIFRKVCLHQNAILFLEIQFDVVLYCFYQHYIEQGFKFLESHAQRHFCNPHARKEFSQISLYFTRLQDG